jgi:hypothetical protein
MSDGGEVSGLGLDWRVIDSEPAGSVEILPPEEAARHAVETLLANAGTDGRTRQVPTGFRLGYVSLPKRRTQRLFEPAYLATFEPDDARGPARAVVVAGVAAPQEPLHREPADIAALKEGARTRARGARGILQNRDN